MAKNQEKKKMNSRVKRTIRKTSAAVLMATAIAVAAIPAGSIEAQDRETNTGIVIDDTRGTYSYQIKDEREGFEIEVDGEKVMVGPDSKSAPVGDYTQINDAKLANYHRKANPEEGVDFERSYSVRRNSQGYYMNWQFAFDTNHVLCKYNDNFAESVVELPYQVATKYYQVSQNTFDYFFEVGNGSIVLHYDFDAWNKEIDKADLNLGDAPTIKAYFPDRLKAFAVTCQKYLDDYEAEVSKIDKQIDAINEKLISDLTLTEEQKQQLIDQRTALQNSYPVPFGERDKSEKPSLDVAPGGSVLSLKEKCNYFCDFFNPSTDVPAKTRPVGINPEEEAKIAAVADKYWYPADDPSKPNKIRDDVEAIVSADRSLKKLSSYGKGSDFTIEFAYDESSGVAKPVYLARYTGTDELGLGAKTDSLGFLITEFSESAITAIGDYAFYNVKSIDTLILPNEIQFIGDYAFATSFMKNVTMPNVRKVGNAAFKNCGQLTRITLDTALLSEIGAEAFYGTALTELTLPYSISQIGAGAFAACTSLKKLDLSAVTTECEIKEAAFYDAMSLSDVKFPPATSKSIKKLGDGCFAVELANQPLAIELPSNMETLPEYLFCNRSNLQSVVMPNALGYTAAKNAKVPKTTFVGCNNLKFVEFPEEAKYVGYDGLTSYKDLDGNSQDAYLLFLDVDTPGFYVKGPAYSSGTVEAQPRQDTWNCISNINNFVPYVYELDGITYYEVSDGKYILTANELGELLSCRARTAGTSPIDLVIPKKVGNYTIKSIADGCFSDEKLRNRLRSITVEDDTLSEIKSDVFKNLPKLKWVDLGNSVASIGDNVFSGCEALEDVTFRSEQVSLGQNAFKTNGDRLTFHGKIASDFGPFVWAMQKDNLVKSNGVRVCYKSLDPTLLTVMYDDGTDLVTLVDYPKYNDLDRLHVQDSINYWYDIYSSEQYDNLRADFYTAWKAAVSDTTDKTAAMNAVYANDMVYGPWVTPRFCVDVVTMLAEDGLTASNRSNAEVLVDSVFPAIKASAADNKPTAFFDHVDHKYTIINKTGASGKVWDELTANENAWIDACTNIVVPSGVQSIDAKGYFTNAGKNGTNIITYFTGLTDGIDAESLAMYKDAHTAGSDGKEVYPGLFSGYYSDYKAGDEKDNFEKSERGNDRIKSITMTDVQYLPDLAFDSCERLEKVVLGQALNSIGTLPFYGCTNLKDVEGNTTYLCDNGLIFDTLDPGDGTYTLVECLPGRGEVVGSRTLPDDADAAESGNVAKLSAIAERAFEECDEVRIVNLFDSSVKTVPEKCFENCDALDMVYLPYSTNVIKADAFKDDKLITVSIPSKEVFIATDAFEHGPKAKADPGDARVSFNTYPESAAAEYAKYYDISLNNMEVTHTVWYNDYNGMPLTEKPFYVKDGDVVAADEKPANPTRQGYEFIGWISSTGVVEGGRIHEDTIFTATYKAVEGTHDGKWYVTLFDGVTGEQIGERLEVEDGVDATSLMPTIPTHDGYTFLKWSTDDYKKVLKDLDIIALYSPKTTPTPSPTPTPTPNPDPNKKDDGNNSNNSSSDSNKNSNSSSDKKYKVTVENGSGSGEYAEGATVAIAANAPAAGQVFSKWTTESKGVSLTNAAMSATTFKMPANDVTVKAEYVASAAQTTAVAPTTTTSNPPGYGDGYGTTNNQKPKDENTNAQVTVSKPGISNIDLATAKVNGSSDSFIIKVTETNEAEEQVRNALTNRYGSIDNRIEYWACDISLYDETGNTKITDTTGLTVDITLPIPDAQRQYGGNNMVGAVADGSLESLTPRFNEINGVPCVTFTATHFSPYTIYVDKDNLVASQMMDATPKTGDPIHPKWFLSIGLACVSILLFMKKDKRVKSKIRTA